MTWACHWLGEVPYLEALSLQHTFRERVLSGEHPGAFLFLTHPPTFTLGRHGNEGNVLASSEFLAQSGAAVHRVDRGGDVTFHGPGQLVGYPIVSLTPLKLGVRDYVHTLSRALARAVGEFGIDTTWDEASPGLWVGRDKLAAFGVHVHRRVTSHGFALNVTTDLNWYRMIVPCGLADRGVTSLSHLLGDACPAFETVKKCVESACEEAFGINFEYNPQDSVVEGVKKER